MIMSIALLMACGSGNRSGPGERAVFGGIVIDIGHLHVKRQIDEHRSGTSAASRAEGLAHDFRHLGRIGDAPGLLGDGLADLRDIDALEGFLAEQSDIGIARNGDQRNRIGVRRVQTGDKVRCPWSGGANRQGQLAGSAEIAVGGMHRALFVPGNVMLNLRVLQVPVYRIDRGAGNAERSLNALVFKNFDDYFCNFHESLSCE